MIQSRDDKNKFLKNLEIFQSNYKKPHSISCKAWSQHNLAYMTSSHWFFNLSCLTDCEQDQTEDAYAIVLFTMQLP